MPTSAKIPLLVVDQIKHFETLYIGITISETFGKDTSVFDIGRPSRLDGLASGLVTFGDILLEDIANQDLLGHTLRSLFFFPGLSRHLGVAGIAAD